MNDGARGLDVEIDDDHFLGTEVCQVDAEGFSNSICSPCYDAYGSFGIEGAFVVTHFYTLLLVLVLVLVLVAIYCTGGLG